MTIWNVVALLLLWAGHTEVCVTLINRIHALPIRCRTLKRIRHVHDVAILAFPFAAVLLWGAASASRFFEGRWSELHGTAVAIYFVCTLGLAGLAWSTTRWWIATRRSMRVGTPTEVIHVRRDLGESPIGEGRMHWLAHVPANEQFLIDVNEKCLLPPNWPVDLDGFSILHLSDWHLCRTYHRRFFERAAEAAAGVRADLIAFTGDLFDDDLILDWLPSTFGRLTAPLGQWFILGNHDSWNDNGEVRGALSNLGWRDVASRTVLVDAGHGELWLGGDETPWIGRRPVWPSDARPRILFSHSPDNFPRAASEGVDVVLAGHNHGGQVLLPVVGPVYSPSRYGCCYPAGVFRRGTSVMHVSRGLAGRHPLRIGCRPEITRLVIRSPRKPASEQSQTAAQAIDRTGARGSADRRPGRVAESPSR
jgi:predicted MPP superfamily phosphohydrolase